MVLVESLSPDEPISKTYYNRSYSAVLTSEKLCNEEEQEEAAPPIEGSGDASSTYIKHPLQHTWTLWYYENKRSKTWGENQREISSFDTIEDFWSLYNYTKFPSELKQGCDYSLFKYGIRPMWEDQANRWGGRWIINLDRPFRDFDVDKLWLEVLLCLIGESFDDYADEICGAVVNVRPQKDKIGLWTSNARNTQAVTFIGRKLKERLNLDRKIIIGYYVHKDTMQHPSSLARCSLTL
ncbi:hypothetical protein R5R35_000014 [Gryllus longicercus]|uniref:eIF-4F 25 kDa subunit n=1 Tax=Gryllus longicercus TaxID=2509291 RepID=A0AAN9V7I8_9ORTH|nr:Eukaryotic translation initiation factor 4E1 [Gryllus bimaculatus]